MAFKRPKHEQAIPALERHRRRRPERGVTTPTTVTEALARAKQVLRPGSDTPHLDAQLLMMHTLGVTRAWLMAHPEAVLSADQANTFDRYLARCQNGEALPYVVGVWEFFGRPYRVTPAVLIPRPETETLVELGLNWLAGREIPQRVVDVGTGSGCIVISLACQFPEHHYLGVDISEEALEVAAQNAAYYGFDETLIFARGDLLDEAGGPFDLICANLPYIPTDRLSDLAVGRREPKQALDGGGDGLEPFGRLAGQLVDRLARGGRLLAELDPEQMEPARAKLEALMPGGHTQVESDLAGHSRVLVFDRGGET